MLASQALSVAEASAVQLLWSAEETELEVLLDREEPGVF